MTLFPETVKTLEPEQLPEVAEGIHPDTAEQVHTGAVAIVGLGYVGLPTALSILDGGGSVIGLDASQSRLDAIRNQNVDLFPDDVTRLGRHLGGSRLALTADAAAVSVAGVVVICVPTPVNEYLEPDLRALASACADVVAQARVGQTIILTSTTYVGCTRDMLIDPLAKRGLTAGIDVHVAFSPERIDPGVVDHRPEHTPRVVGGCTPACTSAAVAALSSTCPSTHRVSSPEAAELTKLLENTFRAVNIALANEISDVACHLGVSVNEVIDAAATKPYGFMPFYPGPGVGGHCIPCDPHYLLWQLRRYQQHPNLISSAMQAISTRPGRIVERAGHVLELSGRALHGARVLVAGVSYKPDVADTRESPARQVIAGLKRRGAQVGIYDPMVTAIDVDGVIYLSESDTTCVADYELVVVCCAHTAMDSAMYDKARLVLDATYRLPAAENRYVP